MAVSPPSSTCRCWRNSPGAGRPSRWAPACTCCPAAAVADFGTQAQKEQFLPDMLGGATLGAYCLSESHAGSDAGAMRTKAVRQGTDEDAEYVITGDKAWITHGPSPTSSWWPPAPATTGSARVSAPSWCPARAAGVSAGVAGEEDGLSGVADQSRSISTESGSRRTGGSAPRARASGSRWPRWTPAGWASRPARSASPRPRWTSPPNTPGTRTRLRADHRRVPGRLVPAGRRRRPDRRRPAAVPVRRPPQGRRQGRSRPRRRWPS